MDSRQPISRKFWIRLVLAPILMFFFAYALVPLYTIICEITGFNGTTGRVYEENTMQIDESRVVDVSFFADTASGFPVKFYPKDTNMEIVPGKFYTTSYIAKNNTNQVIVGQAVPSVAPSDGAAYFKKLECFCFNRQVFQPFEEVEMQVRFIVEPEMATHIKDISLSYNFFRLES